jgi:uncharacterized protein (TIGR02001 family)
MTPNCTNQEHAMQNLSLTRLMNPNLYDKALARKLQSAWRVSFVSQSWRIRFMKQFLFSASVLTGFLLMSAGVLAQDNSTAAAPAPAPAASPLSFNIGLVSDYRYRGISQSRLEPAIQGGLDFAVPDTGWYLGAWGSSIRWIKDTAKLTGVDTGNAPVELDLYGGYKGSIKDGLGYDVGLLAYIYPDNSYANVPGAANANTAEAYGALTFGPATVKYSHSLTTLFGFGNSKNSHYIDLSAGFDVGSGFMITPHVGYQRVRNNSDYSYTDYSVTVSKDIQGFLLSGGIVGTDTKKVGGDPAYLTPDKDDLGKANLFIGVKKTF